jgi:ribosomal protein S18 acetylase RimI-like enzyme
VPGGGDRTKQRRGRGLAYGWRTTAETGWTDPSAIEHDRAMTDYEVRRFAADEWRELRAIRLEALRDTPIGFGERHEDALELPDEDWRQRAARAAESDVTALFAARDAQGRVIGCAGVFPKERAEGEPLVYVIYGVYVTPDHRGADKGVAPLLFDAVIAWARKVGGADVVTLSVHERNDRAHAFYRRYGFVDTGESEPYNLDPSVALLEMRYEG